MKLIQKRCPNCGAKLKFDKNDDEVTCQYCETSFEIEREQSLSDIADDLIDPEYFNLHKKVFNNIRRGTIFISIFMFIFILIMFFIIFFNVFPKVIR